jgi:hypothetical protein
VTAVVTVVAVTVTPVTPVTPVAVAVVAGERPGPPYPTATVRKRATEVVGTEGETEVGPQEETESEAEAEAEEQIDFRRMTDDGSATESGVPTVDDGVGVFPLRCRGIEFPTEWHCQDRLRSEHCREGFHGHRRVQRDHLGITEARSVRRWLSIRHLQRRTDGDFLCAMPPCGRDRRPNGR